MADVIVIGGGPAGLSAALFAAKNGLDTGIFDTDDTWLHSAHLFNYLGIESIDRRSAATISTTSTRPVKSSSHEHPNR